MAYFPLNVRQDALPVQMLPLKQKDDEWKRANLDALESIGRKQFLENIVILENYRMVNNEMLYNHYVFSDSVTDLAQLAVKEFDLPPYLRHYDITRKIINVLSGEYQKRPDIFRVAAVDEFADNEFLRQKGDMLRNMVITQIKDRINQQLMQEGLDPNRTNFSSPEEQEQYQSQVQQETQKLTPESIETYMRESYRSVPEKWGEMIINLDKQRFNTPELEMQEFEDMLICDRAFRHFYLKANGLGYAQETWNPIRVFFHKSPDIRYVEDGDYVGRVFYLSIPEIINRYGHKMTKVQLEDLYGDYLKKKKYGGVEGSFFQATHVPFENYPEYARTIQAFGYDPHTGVPNTGWTGSFGNFTSQDVDVLFNSSSTSYNLQGLTQVTEAYWKSQKKVGFLIMQDPVTKEIIEELVDETFEIPDFVEEVEDDLSYEDMVFSPQKKMNTIRWTWINESWGGIKISAINNTNPVSSERGSGTPGNTGIYIDPKPLSFQFKGDTNPYECKLPVCGAIFNNRNAKSMSLVDMMKPYQILYNVFMNRIFQLASTEIGKVLLLDPRMIPNDKDWGGEKNLEKWRTIAREYKIGQIDTSPGARAGGMQFNQFTVHDLREFDNIKATIEIARLIEEQAMYQVGITQARLGNIQASQSATGVEQSVNNSFAQTESYFTKFANYKKRVLQMNLDIAQYCSATNRDMTISLIQDDMQREFNTLNGLDLLNSQLGIRVFNSQELIRQNEMMKQLILKNNTANASMSSLAAALYTESPSRLITILKKMEDDMKAQMEAERQSKERIEEMKLQDKREERAFEAEQNELDREARLREAMIKVTNFDTDTADNGKVDVVEIGKMEIEKQRLQAETDAAERANVSKLMEQSQRRRADKEKLEAEKEMQNKDHQLAKQEMEAKKKLLEEQGRQAAEENKTQLRLSKEKHDADMAIMEKELELANLELEANREKKKNEIASTKDDLKTKQAKNKNSVNVEKKVADDNVNTAKALNRLKVATAKKLADQRVKDAKKPKKSSND